MIKKTISEILEETTSMFPDNDALVYNDKNLRMSYYEFNDYCDSLAKGLIALGINKGDKIAVWAYNIPEWVFLQFASAKIGAILVTVNTYYKSFELEYLLKQSDSKALFLTSGFKDVDYIKMVYTILPDLEEKNIIDIQSNKFPFLKKIIFFGDKKYPSLINYKELISLGKDVSDENLSKIKNLLNCNDTINMQYTSGTTGPPKGCVHFVGEILIEAQIVNNNVYKILSKKVT